MNDPAAAGLRAEIDVIARGNWVLGMSGGESKTTSSTHGATDRIGTIYAAYSWTRGATQLRAAFGVGGALSSAYGNTDSSTMSYSATGAGTAVEGSLRFTYRLGDSWGVTAGPLVHRVSQEMTTDAGASTSRREVSVFVFAGLRVRL